MISPNEKSYKLGMPNTYLEPRVRTLEEHRACGPLGKVILIRDDYRFICRDYQRPGLAAALLFLFVREVDGQCRDLNLRHLLCEAWQDCEVLHAREWLKARHLVEAEYLSRGIKYWPNFVLIEIGQNEFAQERLDYYPADGSVANQE